MNRKSIKESFFFSFKFVFTFFKLFYFVAYLVLAIPGTQIMYYCQCSEVWLLGGSDYTFGSLGQNSLKLIFKKKSRFIPFWNHSDQTHFGVKNCHVPWTRIYCYQLSGSCCYQVVMYRLLSDIRSFLL